ncbi:MAG: hypothetical protein J7M15_01235 [Anaerolineae bacterium]|nr:hypothetical protein [Anaerolineae bacterium]
MVTYGDITRSQMAFLIELVRRSRELARADPRRASSCSNPQEGPDQTSAADEHVEWLLTFAGDEGKLIRAGASWSGLPADREFYESLGERGYLGFLASDGISGNEVVIWPTERAVGLADWATSSGKDARDDPTRLAPK